MVPQLLQHPRFAALETSLVAAWSGAVATRCERVLPSATTPFLAALARAYCKAGGRDVRPAAPELPLFSQSPAHRRLRARRRGSWPVAMTQAFDASPWAWRPSAQHAGLSVSGQLDVSYSDQRVVRTAHWTVQVPYTTTRWTQVPVTTYQYYSYPCGRSTCSGSRPVVGYRGPSRARR